MADPYIVLAAAACATSTMTIGLLGEYDGPAETLAVLAGGRLVLSSPVDEIAWWTGDPADGAAGLVATGARSSSDVALLKFDGDVVLLGRQARHEDGTAADFEALAAAGATWWLETVDDSLAEAYATITSGPPGPPGPPGPVSPSGY